MADDVAFVKNDILDWFRNNKRNVGVVNIGEVWFQPAFNAQRGQYYTPNQRAAVSDALKQLVTEGILEEKDGNWFITAKGVNIL